MCVNVGGCVYDSVCVHACVRASMSVRKRVRVCVGGRREPSEIFDTHFKPDRTLLLHKKCALLKVTLKRGGHRHHRHHRRHRIF